MKGVNPLHAGAWGAWLLAAGVALSVTRNPIYLGLILAWIAAVWWVAGHMAGIMNPERAVPLSPLRFGIFVVCVSAVFNALMISAGEFVLFRLPEWLPLVGGPFTVEALVYGAMNGVVLTGLYAAFLLVNRVLPVRDIVRLVPQAYHSVAIVVSIAVTFVPETMRQFRQIREAQAVRGHRIQGIRGFLPLLLPLLTGGMERALRLAEAMTARGYASAEAQESQAWTNAGLVIGLGLFTAGLLIRLVWGALTVGALLAVAGALLIVVLLWITGAAVPHSVYRPAPWRIEDWLVVAGAALTASVFLLPWPGMDRSSIYYYPYPSLSMPELSIWIGIATWGLLMPAVVMMWAEMRAPTGEAGVQ